ncbi:hypothetical protein Syun_019402 [Stephania yunnanensis]|uniref:Uncharacterized protein n=1 Tax=Stephania yunnanensis TaxID=152371 RepID=A0AAP0IV93_9MAGN
MGSLMVEGERRRRAETDEKSYQKNQLREFFNGDRIVFDFFLFNGGGEEHVETHEGERGPREKADDREPDEEVAEEDWMAPARDGDGAFGSVEEAERGR